MRLPEFLYQFLNDLERLERMSELPWRPEDLTTGVRILKRLFKGERGSLGGSEINVIPPIGYPGRCRPILLVAIGSGDSVERRILEAIEHISVKCKGITMCVIFYAAKWDHVAWLKHSDSFTRTGVTAVLKAPFFAKSIPLT